MRSGLAHRPSLGSRGSSPASGSQTLCFPRLSDMPQGACFLPASLVPLPPPSLRLVHLTLNKVLSTRGKSLQKMLCPCPSFLCPAYHKITIYKEEKEKISMVLAPRKPLSAIISCPRSSLDSSIKESCMKFPKYSINNPLQ